MSANKVNKAATQILAYVAALFVLLLTAINILNYQTPKKVLGVETEEENDIVFWQEYLKENPNYLPGWAEIGREDKIKEIDPNYKVVYSE